MTLSFGSSDLIHGISFWQPWKVSKYYCYIFPVWNWRQVWYLAHLKHVSLNQNFGMSNSKLLHKTKAFTSVQFYDFTLKSFVQPVSFIFIQVSCIVMRKGYCKDLRKCLGDYFPFQNLLADPYFLRNTLCWDNISF